MLVLSFCVCLLLSCTPLTDGEEAPKLGCVTGNQAQSMNEEIIQMLEATPYAELMTTMATTVTSSAMEKLEKCLEGVKVLYKMSCMIVESVGQNGGPIMQQFENYKNLEITGFKSAYEMILSPLVQNAQSTEVNIHAGNQRRLIMLDIITRFRETWMALRNIRRENEKTLQSMDIFLKDSIMEKSAQIGQMLLKGNSERLNVRSVKEQLEALAEITNINKMINVYAAALSGPEMVTRHGEFVKNYITSQLAFAVRKTSLEDSMRQLSSDDVRRIFSFSELHTSNGIKHSAKLTRDGLAVGYEEAKNYTNVVNSTVEGFQKTFESLSSISIMQDCKKTKEMILSISSVFASIFSVVGFTGPGIAASNYRTAIENLYSGQVLPVINQNTIQPAIRIVLNFLPQMKNPDVNEAYQFLDQFANSPMAASNIESFNGTMVQVSKYTNKLLDGFRCYRKIFQLIGNVIQGCKDGQQNFNELYADHSSRADLSKCTEMSILNTPSKNDVQQILSSVAQELGFNADCMQNKQSDDVGIRYYDDGLDYADDEGPARSPMRLSGGQRHMVCSLKKNATLTEEMIAKKIIKPVEVIRGVRCRAAAVQQS